MLYSGLPIAEEQRYTGSQYLPAVANLRAKYSSQKFGLQDAIAKITSDQYNQAYGVRQGELKVDEDRRQFQEQLAAQERSAAATRAAAGSAGSSFSPSLGGQSAGSQSAAATPDLTGQFQSFLQRQYSANPNASRAEQDNWVRAFAQGNKMNANASNDPHGIWSMYNNLYPYAQYSRTATPGAGAAAFSIGASSNSTPQQKATQNFAAQSIGSGTNYKKPF